MVSGLAVDHVTAVVADVDAAEEVLSRVLGAAPVVRLTLPDMTIRTFQIGAVQLHVNAPQGPGPVADFHGRHGAGLHHLALRVPDLDAALRDLLALGLPPLGQPAATAPGLREVFLDPRHTAGLLIQLVERAVDGAEAGLDAEAVAGLAAQLAPGSLPEPG